jgi:hypothetical protein
MAVGGRGGQGGSCRCGMSFRSAASGRSPVRVRRFRPWLRLSAAARPSHGAAGPIFFRQASRGLSTRPTSRPAPPVCLRGPGGFPRRPAARGPRGEGCAAPGPPPAAGPGRAAPWRPGCGSWAHPGSPDARGASFGARAGSGVPCWPRIGPRDRSLSPSQTTGAEILLSPRTIILRTVAPGAVQDAFPAPGRPGTQAEPRARAA